MTLSAEHVLQRLRIHYADDVGRVSNDPRRLQFGKLAVEQNSVRFSSTVGAWGMSGNPDVTQSPAYAMAYEEGRALQQVRVHKQETGFVVVLRNLYIFR